MITRHEIIMSMGTMDMRNTALKNELLKYVNICLAEVDEIIRAGVDGWLAPFIAFVLKMKKHIPDGFNPPLRRIVTKPKQLILDGVYHGTKRGKAHHNYKNGSCARNHPLAK